jgi:tyrosyl-tRNA synthetase
MQRLGGTRALAADYVCPRCAIRAFVRRPQPSRYVHTTPPQNAQETGVLNILEERGLVSQIAGDSLVLRKLLAQSKLGIYAGIDPTAPSLHLGHMLPLMVLFWLHNYGHNVVSLVGGATATLGDPSGRLTSRAKTADSVHESNFKEMFAQLGRLWKNAESYAERHGYQSQRRGQLELLDNAAWHKNLTALELAKVLGSGTRLGAMLSRDT